MRLIDADEALEYLEDLCRRTGLVKTDADVDYNQFSLDWIVRYIEARPTAVTERRGRWISVEDGLPEEHKMVLCYTPVDGFMCVGFCRVYEWRGKKNVQWFIVTAMRSTKTLTKKVTHWMELPGIPEPSKE